MSESVVVLCCAWCGGGGEGFASSNFRYAREGGILLGGIFTRPPSKGRGHDHPKLFENFSLSTESNISVSVIK